MSRRLRTSLTYLVSLALASHHAAAAKQRWDGIMDLTPKFPYDASTTPYCNEWHNDDGDTWSCQDIYQYKWVKEADFLRWNPSVVSICASGGSLPAKRSFCVRADSEPKSTTRSSSTTTASPRSTTRATTTPQITSTTTTVTGNGIETPRPTQPGMASNCNRFHLVQPGDSCDAIAASAKVPSAKLAEWNDVGDGCSALWADVYLCVGIVGYAPPTITTTTGNGIATPQPTQPGMVSNCNKFYLVQPGNTCDAITRSQGIPLNDFVQWNTQIGGAACTGMWANVYVCVGVVGYTPTTTTTRPGNGIQTPTPTQPGLVNNCRRFYLVAPGDTCDAIARANGISVEVFKQWNQGVGADCTSMWANTYACVGV